jgi:tetratricopeptide (TPR) repeat protein
MAFTLANVMLKDGIPAAIAYHNIAKDSSNYFNTEREMSYAGYYLLQGDKVKEATALLKLDTELFPNSFNAFDSYAEALSIAGDKTNAIENFKKSVRLNPGSINGLKRLKELGINPNDVVKPVKNSMEELKLLEGVYLSTNQPNWIRKITITAENGILMGEDNTYRYKLIYMGDGKFINPDDGESLVFNTKDKNVINLLLFGEINLKKIKSSKEPVLNLKEYVGRYAPEKKDTILRTIEVINEGNKLFRISGKDPKGPGGTLELKFVTDNLFYYSDNTGRSMEFMLNDKKQVTGILLRRTEGTYKLSKEK